MPIAMACSHCALLSCQSCNWRHRTLASLPLAGLSCLRPRDPMPPSKWVRPSISWVASHAGAWVAFLYLSVRAHNRISLAAPHCPHQRRYRWLVQCLQSPMHPPIIGPSYPSYPSGPSPGSTGVGRACLKLCDPLKAPPGSRSFDVH